MNQTQKILWVHFQSTSPCFMNSRVHIIALKFKLANGPIGIVIQEQDNVIVNSTKATNFSAPEESHLGIVNPVAFLFALSLRVFDLCFK